MSHLKNMPPPDGLEELKTSIKRAETKAEEKERHRKVKVFKWQGRTAAICLLARAVLLYHYVEYMIGAQQANSITKLLSDNLVAVIFLFMEIAFTREHGSPLGERLVNKKPVYRLYPQHLQSIQFASKARFRPRLWLEGVRVPTVDILVFYCGEEVCHFYPFKHVTKSFSTTT